MALRGWKRSLSQSHWVFWAFIAWIFTGGVWGVSILLRGRGYARTIQKMFSDWENIVEIINFVAQYGGMILFGVSTILLAILLFRIPWQWSQNAKGLRAKFATDFHNYANTRANLWDMLDTASAKYRQVEVDPGSVRSFLREVELPQDVLSIPRGESLYDYARKAHDQWDGKCKEFLHFCLALYQQGNASPLSPQDFARFNGLRQDLTKFWDRWGIRCKDQGMSVSDIADPDLIQSQTPDVVMLTYLEIAYGLCRKENSRGKQELFAIAKDFCEESNNK